MLNNKDKEFWLIGVSFFLIYVVWGSTYLANAWGIRSVPPFIYAGTRFVIAGALLYFISRSKNKSPITKIQLKNTIIAGFMFFAIGNGLVVWSLKFMDSGITSLVVAFQPLVVVFLMWSMRSQKPNRYSWAGVIIGLIGMYFLGEQPEFGSNPEWLIGVAAIFIALLTWGFSLIWMKDADLPDSIFQSAALQMFFGGLMMFVISLGLGEWTGFEIGAVPPIAIWALLYLIIIGSVLTFSAFNYLIKKVSPDKVSTSAFVNPVIALFLGAWLNSEFVSSQSVFAATLLLTGVLFINGQVKTLVGFFTK
ncbi:MAG: drug/metabolite transporter (DMT)-like permease [Polaribacter sp.]|jgi:drug/metabolite transporter (DMT)-like permease